MSNMPRSFLIKKTNNNYSNCPLKKRPYKELLDDDKKDDNSEPENLSTKPEDLSITSQNHYPHKSITPPPAIALVTSAPVRPVTPAPHYLAKTSGGPLEPLNLNTPAETPHHPYATTWHRPTGPAPTVSYPPPAYYYHPYTPTEVYHQYSPVYPVSPTARHPHHQEQQLSPYAPRDSTGSPPNHLLTPFRSAIPVVASLPHRQHQASELPRLYMPYQNVDHCGLSPTSSIASSSSIAAFQSLSPPPATPEDLSSPGSVSSGSSSGSTSAGKKRKEGAVSGGTAGPRYQCPDCAKSYSTYSGLSKHQQFHCAATAGAQAKKSFSCKYCEKVYVSLGALKMHIRTHTLPCKCKLCGKAFSRPWLLQGHIRTHTGEKPFSCPHCNRAFADRSNLRAHLQTHSDVKKYSCTTCSKTFSRMSLLTKHMDGGCPGTGIANPAPPLVSAISHLILGNGIHRDSTSSDECKIYHDVI